MANRNRYREFMKACMLRKNLKGQPADVIRAELAKCAQAWTEALEARGVVVVDERALAEQYLPK
ncbi:hypothetical protein ES708_31326 [subsurface metagenome]